MISDNVNVDGLAHMETDGLPDPLTDPSAEKVFLSHVFIIQKKICFISDQRIHPSDLRNRTRTAEGKSQCPNNFYRKTEKNQHFSSRSTKKAPKR